MVSLSILGGVPVLSLNVFIPSLFNESVREVDAFSPSGPPEKEDVPEMILEFK